MLREGEGQTSKKREYEKIFKNYKYIQTIRIFCKNIEYKFGTSFFSPVFSYGYIHISKFVSIPLLFPKDI